MEDRRTIEDLKNLQALPLNLKVRMTQDRIRQWVYEYGEDGVYISFSGGKDSTVLLHIVRELYPDIPAAFMDTGLEYPEIREFVKTFDNVEWIKPEMNFKQVINKYGYPMFSKEVSQSIHEVKRKIDNGKEPPAYRMNKFNGTVITPKTGKLSPYNIPQYKFALYAPFRISHMCCAIMKKRPSKQYEKQTGRKPFLAMMADESLLRQQKWLKDGCNAFNSKRQTSNPMSFWTEQDVLKYIRDNNITICSVYGDIVTDDEESGQMTVAQWLGAEDVDRPLHCTGLNRTGCMFCGFGIHLQKSPNKFEQMKHTHPKQYAYIMKPIEDGGLGFKEVIDWINEHGNMDIKY